MNETNSNEPIAINYKFTFEDETEKEFKINLDKTTLDLIQTPKESYPEWTALPFEKCSNCPLNESEHKHCPIAVNLIDIIDFFSKIISYQEATTLIETNERGYQKKTPVQKSVSSLIGIYMVTSGCPIMNKLRPMVRFHLPFASIEETTYRSISMYLCAQYFLNKHGKTPDWDLKNLTQLYESISKVNAGFCHRLRKTGIEDAALNAITKLDCFALNITFSLSDLSEELQNEPGSLFNLFQPYY